VSSKNNNTQRVVKNLVTRSTLDKKDNMKEIYTIRKRSSMILVPDNVTSLGSLV